MLEIVRLPVPPGTEGEVAAFLEASPYFGQQGLLAHRILVGEQDPEIALVLEWASHDAGRAAITSDIGRTFLAGLQERLAGAPQITYYEPR